MKEKGKKTLTEYTKQIDVVMLAVYLLGGEKRSIDTEDVAIKSHELAPGMFSWQKYPDQINLEIVRVNLSNAKKPEYREMLSGSGREGWRLTSRGIDWIASDGQLLLEQDALSWDSKRTNAGSVDSVRKRREKKRILSSSAWASWNDGEPLNQQETQLIFRIDEYATEKMAEIKIVRMRSLFEEDEEIGAFLREAAKHVLGSKSEG